MSRTLSLATLRSLVSRYSAVLLAYNSRSDLALRGLGTFSVVIGVIYQFIWFLTDATQYASFGPLGYPIALLPYESSLCFLCCGAALIAESFDHRRSMLVFTSLAFLVLVIVVGGLALDVGEGVIQRSLFGRINSLSASRTAMRASDVFAFFLVFLTLLSVANGIKRTCLPLLLTILGLLVCSISISMLLHTVSGLDVVSSVGGAAEPNSTALVHALGIFLLGAGVIVLAWREWNTLSVDVAELKRSFLMYCTIAALFIAGVSSWFTLSLLHERFSETSRRNLEKVAREKARSIELVLTDSKRTANRFANFSDTYRLMDAYDRGELKRAGFSRATSEYFENVLDFDERIAGITLLDRFGVPLVVHGQVVPPEQWPENAAEREKPGIVGPLSIDGTFMLVVSAPILQFPLRRIGTVVLLLRASGFEHPLRDRTLLGESGTVVLGVPTGDGFKVLTHRGKDDSIGIIDFSANSSVYQGLSFARKQESGFIGSGEGTVDDTLTFYLPVPESSLALAASIGTRELQTSIRRKFIAVAALITAFVALAGYGMFQLVRTLLWYADALQLRLVEKSRALEEELAWRTKAEEELSRHRDHLEKLVLERTSELQESQLLLSQSERMASIGIFAAGIAHEINNPIGMILLASQNALSLSKEPDAEEITQNALEEIEANARRCGRIVRSILQFSRQEDTEKWPSDVNAIIEHSVELMVGTVTDDPNAVSLDLDPSLPQLPLNPTEIEQLVINLCKNAFEAGGDGTRVSITSRKIGALAEIRISDNGPGMNSEQRKMAFDPFFTTKQHQGGTGLGLSIVHGIVEGHKGKIEIDSTPGVGTTFSVNFPTCA